MADEVPPPPVIPTVKPINDANVPPSPVIPAVKPINDANVPPPPAIPTGIPVNNVNVPPPPVIPTVKPINGTIPPPPAIPTGIPVNNVNVPPPTTIRITGQVNPVNAGNMNPAPAKAKKNLAGEIFSVLGFFAGIPVSYFFQPAIFRAKVPLGTYVTNFWRALSEDQLRWPLIISCLVCAIIGKAIGAAIDSCSND